MTNVPFIVRKRTEHAYAQRSCRFLDY